MQMIDWIQLAVFLFVVVLLTKPLGHYLAKVLSPNERTFLDFALKPVERLLYRACGIDPFEEQDWKQYLACLMGFSFLSLLLTGILLAIQGYLPLNPQGFAAPSCI